MNYGKQNSKDFCPDFPTLNHHWASGLVFWEIFRLGGFSTLLFFNLLLNLATFFIFFFLAYKSSGIGLAVFVSLPLIPLLAERTEIRPEIFSYFLPACFFYFYLSKNISGSYQCSKFFGLTFTFIFS